MWQCVRVRCCVARYSGTDAARIEEIEGDLALLGNARIYAKLLRERVGIAAQAGGMAAVLSHALDDIQRMDDLIRRTQQRISDRWRSD